MAERPLFIKLNLPDGLEEALEGLAREVLREKPGNIYEFAADYFEELVKKRNEGIHYFPLNFLLLQLYSNKMPWKAPPFPIKLR